jgi:hypothetical protein
VRYYHGVKTVPLRLKIARLSRELRDIATPRGVVRSIER